ncbi:MAG: hypothetical protein ABIG45_09340 [Bacillota bacterium]
MDNEKKLKALAAIARKLNQDGITWAVGGSMLLYFKNIVPEFHDIDIMVMEEDAQAAKEALMRMGALKPSKPKPQYKTKTFLEFVVGGVEVDVLAGFAIVKDGVEYDCSLKKGEITEFAVLENEKIPLHSLTAWRRNYELMGEAFKVKLIDATAVKSESPIIRRNA